MPRAPSRCSPTCPKTIIKYGKCEIHQPVKVPWQGSNRQTEFFKSAEWQRQRRRILFRDERACRICGAGDSHHVDHIVPQWYAGEQVSDDELQTLCKKCHDRKSSYEGVQAKRIHASKRSKI